MTAHSACRGIALLACSMSLVLPPRASADDTDDPAPVDYTVVSDDPVDELDDVEELDDLDEFEDEPDDEPSTLSIEGTVRAGWRFLSGRDEGRFLQDINLGPGPRLFDFIVAVRDSSEDALIDELELQLRDVGERSSDGRIVLRRSDKVQIEGGYSRDLFDYRAGGDPFPLDTVRERSFTRVRLSPSRKVTVRAGWERSRVRGDAERRGDTDLREAPPPAGVDEDIVFVNRPLDQLFDTFDLGVDASVGVVRLGLTQTVRRGRIDDERLYDVPPARRGLDPVREQLRRRVRSTFWTTTFKAAATVFEGSLDLSLIAQASRGPSEARFSGNSAGFDNAFEGGTPKGAFTASTGGDTDIDKRASIWTFDGDWQVLDELEISLSFEQDEVVEDAELDLTESRIYERVDVGREQIITRRRGRATNRVDRSLIEAIYDVTEKVRARAGREWLRQDVESPFETRRGTPRAGEIRGSAARWVAGLDVDASDDVSLSLLVRHSDEDEPHAARSAEHADEVSFRARARLSKPLRVTGTHRYKGFQNGDKFDSQSRAHTSALAATYSQGKWTANVTLSHQQVTTRTDTSILFFDGTSLVRLAPTLSFATRDMILSGGASYEVAPGLRLRGDAVLTRTTGDREISTHALSIGAEHDLRDDVTIAAAVRSWRFNEHGRSVDDYDSEALELWVEWRF